MNRILNSLSIGQRLMLILTVPLCGLLLYIGLTVYQKLEDTRLFERSLVVSRKLATNASNAIHAWQAERELAMAFAFEGNGENEDALRFQILDTNKETDRLQESIDSLAWMELDDEFRNSTDAVSRLLGGADAWRIRLLSGDVSPNGIRTYYGRMIASHETAIAMAARSAGDHGFAVTLLSFCNLLRAKEGFVLKHSYASEALSREGLTRSSRDNFAIEWAHYRSRLEDFFAFGDPRHVEAYRRIMGAGSVEQMEEWDQLVFSGEKFDAKVSLDEWNSAANRQFNLMKEVVNMVEVDLYESSDGILKANQFELYAMIGYAALIILASIVLSLWIARMTSEHLRATVFALKNGAEEVTVASLEVAKASCGVANSTRIQADMLNETCDSLSGITRMAKDGVDLTDRSTQMLSSIVAKVDRGKQDLAFLSSSVKELGQPEIDAESLQQTIEGLYQNLRNTLIDINESVNELSGISAKMNTMAKKQLDGAEEIRENVRRQEEEVISFSAASDETAAAAHEMNAQAKEIENAIKMIGRQAGLAAAEMKVDVVMLDNAVLKFRNADWGPGEKSKREPVPVAKEPPAVPPLAAETEEAEGAEEPADEEIPAVPRDTNDFEKGWIGIG